MHLGELPERAIHGEAKLAEAKALIDEGVPVLPLPFIPKAKTKLKQFHRNLAGGFAANL